MFCFWGQDIGEDYPMNTRCTILNLWTFTMFTLFTAIHPEGLAFCRGSNLLAPVIAARLAAMVWSAVTWGPWGDCTGRCPFRQHTLSLKKRHARTQVGFDQMWFTTIMNTIINRFWLIHPFTNLCWPFSLNQCWPFQLWKPRLHKGGGRRGAALLDHSQRNQRIWVTDRPP